MVTVFCKRRTICLIDSRIHPAMRCLSLKKRQTNGKTFFDFEIQAMSLLAFSPKSNASTYV